MSFILGSVLFVVALLSGCGPNATSSNKELSNESRKSATELTPVNKVSPTEGYVPDSQCRSCHLELYDDYQSLGMARSFYPASTDNLIENFEANHYYHALSDQHFEMLVKDDGIYQRRYQLDSDGKRINQLEVRADYIIGSGNHIRSYIYRTPSGEMFQMPLAWYSKTQEWAMNPGYDIPDHLGFDRKITRECMFCHNAYPLEAAPGSDEYWQPHVFSEQLPHGIGCQRCHGPGQQHIELAESPTSSLDEVNDAIVNPDDLSPELSQDVCNQCHLQPSVQVLTQLVRADRPEYSFRPGQSLAEYRALLDFEFEDEERFEINHHAYRMRQSRCFIESNEAMSCLSCHDPHRKVPEANRIRHYRDACLQCHQVDQCQTAMQQVSSLDEAHDEPLAGIDCASCHMPERRAHDVIHASMTDHKIVAKPESNEVLMAERREPPPAPPSVELSDYWPERPRGADADVEPYLAIAGAQLGNTRALQSLINYVRDNERGELMPLAELASALQDQAAYAQELQVLQRAVELYPEHVQTNLEMGMALAAAGQSEQANFFYQRALEIGPPLPETYVGLGMTKLNRGDLKGAEEHFVAAVKLRPLYADALLNLGIVLYAQQQWDAAKEFLLRAQAVEPKMTEAKPYLDAIDRRR